MKTSDIQIVELHPMRVASAYGFGEQPEEAAWNQLAEWARPKGLLDDLITHPLFGFNNPYPIPGASKYGYEFWIKVGNGVEPSGPIRITEFMGGTYASLQCNVKGHPEDIPSRWQELVQWCRDTHRILGKQPALEGFLTTPDDLQHLVLNLYCPLCE